MSRRVTQISFLLAVVLFSACNTFKYLPEGEKLYTGANLKVRAEGKVDGGRKDLQYELEEVVSPTPNRQIFGIRAGLWLHYKAAEKPNKKWLQKLNKRYGEKPVLMSDVNPIRNEKILLNRLENNGYFGAQVSSEIKTKDKKGSVTYKLKVPEPYVLKTYTYLPDSSAIDSLNYSFSKTLIKIGAQFDTDLLKKERTRIDKYLKDRGFYHFNEDFLVFTMDTNHYENKGYDLYLTVKKNTPTIVVDRYKIKDITVYPDYSIEESDTLYKDTTSRKGILFMQGESKFKPKHLEDYILIRQGDFFSQEARLATTRRISSMGIFQYVSVRYNTDSLSNDSVGYLNASIQLSPYPKHSLRVEMQGVTKSNSFAGPALIVSYANRNLFKGGEILEISGNTSYESQIVNGSQKGLSSFQFSLNNSLTIPRIFPFKVKSRGGYSVPKTRFGLNGSFIDRVQYYRLNSFQLEYGFNWNSSEFISQSINPIDLTYSDVSRTTAEFDSILANNTFLAQSFEDQFIPGLTYSFIFNQLTKVEREHRFFFKGTIDIAGNLLGAFQAAANTNREILGLPYAQFIKADIDGRHYARVGRESYWVTRLFVGWSRPYGNSSTLPYIKQYFSGGPNSIRAFKVRSLGPGTYDASSTGTSFFDQSGDLKLEYNSEFRHPIISLLKGAVFLDAGNIWLVNANSAIPGGEFTKNWYRQIAMGFGYGLRLDIDFLVIRFDFATPLRTPYNNASERWIDDVGVWKGRGFNNNVVVNFSIGYPF